MASLLQLPDDYYALDKELDLKKMMISYKRTTVAEGQKPHHVGIVFATPDQEMTTMYGNAALNHL